MKSNKKRVLSGRIISLMLYTMLIILLISFLVQAGLIQNPLKKLNKTIEERNVTDACSIIGGKLIHSIKDEESCGNICVAECESDKSALKKSEFIAGVNSCNACSCYCIK